MSAQRTVAPCSRRARGSAHRNRSPSCGSSQPLPRPVRRQMLQLHARHAITAPDCRRDASRWRQRRWDGLGRWRRDGRRCVDRTDGHWRRNRRRGTCRNHGHSRRRTAVMAVKDLAQQAPNRVMVFPTRAGRGTRHRCVAARRLHIVCRVYRRLTGARAIRAREAWPDAENDGGAKHDANTSHESSPSAGVCVWPAKRMRGTYSVSRLLSRLGWTANRTTA
jgi:hypothetical protein